MSKKNLLLSGFSSKLFSKFNKIGENDFNFYKDSDELKDEKIHLIVLNWKSDDLCERLQNFLKNNLFSTVPVLLYTPVNETIVLQCFQNGIDDFIDEKLPNEVVKAKIKAYLNCRNKLKSGKKKIKIGGLLINPKKRKVTRKGVDVDLTKIEYDILLLLSQDRTKIFSREEIYKQIWGDKVIVGERTLDVHMNNLRKKIGKNKIRTKKGVGFGINPDL